MNITLKKRGLIFLLLVASVASGVPAVAQSHSFGGGFFVQDRQRQNDNRRNMDGRRFDDRYNDRGYRQQQRRDDRLSPDERRMLRQQIDEAGRDIYAPRRR